MTAQEIKRKLTAIFSADVKGYSRLMGEDEVATLKTLSAHFQIMTTLIQKHQGRVLNMAGDNLLADFESVVDAVQCGVEIQKELRSKNVELAEGRRVEFRIGVNLGDVIREGDTIYGDGVNIAERVQSLADGGGICISGTAFDQVRNKVDLGYEYLGEQIVKNIALPVRVYKGLMEPEAIGKVIGEKKAKPKQWQRATIGLVIGVIVVAAVVVIWRFYAPPAPQKEVPQKDKIEVSKPEKAPTVTPPSTEVAPKEKVALPSPEKVSKPAPPPAPKMEVASKDKMGFPLPDEPSIAVLPFVNMSRDPDQEYFSDGITEEIITALSKVPNLFVIARNSTFTYKGKPVKVQQVSEELGVRYVLEGSVRKAGDNVRVTAQLIDALTGRHLWAERYDRKLEQIFILQDEITMKIITDLRVKLGSGEQIRLGLPCTVNLPAYLKYLEAMNYFIRRTSEDNLAARRLTEEAISLEPSYACAYSLLGTTYIIDVLLGSAKSPKDSFAKARENIDKAIGLNPSLAGPRAMSSMIYRLIGQHEKAIEEAEKALSLDLNSRMALAEMGAVLRTVGRSEESIPYIEKAIRIDPLSTFYDSSLGLSYLFAGKWEEAIRVCKRATDRDPRDIMAFMCLASACSTGGREQEARAAASEILRINPKFSVEFVSKNLILKKQADKDLYIEGLRKAGLK
jgi:TolB-like protein/class 3 adenylate cyclase/Flp pilus assembly protein TadD